MKLKNASLVICIGVGILLLLTFISDMNTFISFSNVLMKSGIIIILSIIFSTLYHTVAWILLFISAITFYIKLKPEQ